MLIKTCLVVGALALSSIAATERLESPAYQARHAQPPALTPEQREAIAQLLGAPAGSQVEVQVQETQEKDGGSSKTTEEASGEGAGLRARGDKVESGFDGSAPGANLGAGRAGATGGGVKADTDVVTFRPPSVSSPLLWVGIALLVASGVCIYLHLRRAAFVAGGLGACMIAAGSFPAAFAWIVAIAALGVGGFYLWTEWAKKHSDAQAAQADKLKEALRAVVGGVAGLKGVNQNAYEAVKKEVEKQATAEDQDVIKQIKRADQL